MPGESGTAIRRAAAREAEPLRSAPILMLTALTETANRVEGLEAGVDDYLAKPFDPRELSLRIASILRRARRRPEPARAQVRFGDFVFDPARGELLREGEPVRLTTRERDFCRRWWNMTGAIVPRQTLAQRDRRVGPPASAASTSRSRGCAARSKPTPMRRAICRPCAAMAIACLSSRRARAV